MSISEPWDDPGEGEEAAEIEAEAARLLADHDPTGIELAASIAHQTIASAPRAGEAVTLPPPRGVSKGRPRRGRRPTGVQFSGSGPDERDPQTVGAVLGRVIRDRGWSTQVNVRSLLARWSELVGPTNAAHSTPESFSEGVLTIRAESTTWATSLRALTPNLVAELNARLGQQSVTRIVVLGPQAPSWKHGRRSVPGRGPRDTYG